MLIQYLAIQACSGIPLFALLSVFFFMPFILLWVLTSSYHIHSTRDNLHVNFKLILMMLTFVLS